MLGDLGHGHVAADEEVAGALHPVIIHVIDGRAVHDGLEEAAEVLRRHARQPRQRLQRDALAVVGLDVLQRRLQLLGLLPEAGGGRVQHGPVPAAHQRAEQRVQAAGDLQHVFISPGPAAPKQRGRRASEPLVGFDDLALQEDAVVQHPLQPPGAGILPHQQARVEHRALVNAILRLAAVNHAPGDQHQVPRLGHRLPVFDVQAQTPVAHVDQLRLPVPVHRHAIALVVNIHRIPGQRKIPGAVLYLFVVVQVMHAASVAKW